MSQSEDLIVPDESETSVTHLTPDVTGDVTSELVANVTIDLASDDATPDDELLKETVDLSPEEIVDVTPKVTTVLTHQVELNDPLTCVQCADCGKSCESIEVYKKHYYSEHLNQATQTKTYSVKNVQVVNKRKVEELKKQNKSPKFMTEGLRPYACSKCDLKFRTLQKLVKHSSDEHENKTEEQVTPKAKKPKIEPKKNYFRIKCDTCPFTFSSQVTLKCHTCPSDPSIAAQCSDCEYVFPHKENLARHLELTRD